MVEQKGNNSLSKNARLEITATGRTCNIRAIKITDHIAELRELNLEYPGERCKPFADRDPAYILRRSQIAATLEVLVSRQKADRRHIRQRTRFS